MCDSKFQVPRPSSIIVIASLGAILLGGTIPNCGADSLIIADVSADTLDRRTFVSPVTFNGI